MNYPTITEVESASRYQICKWHRFLSSPINEDEVKIKNRIFKRLEDFGGFTPEISKAIGW